MDIDVCVTGIVAVGIGLHVFFDGSGGFLVHSPVGKITDKFHLLGQIQFRPVYYPGVIADDISAGSGELDDEHVFRVIFDKILESRCSENPGAFVCVIRYLTLLDKS